jgi:hypothetical protein
VPAAGRRHVLNDVARDGMSGRRGPSSSSFPLVLEEGSAKLWLKPPVEIVVELDLPPLVVQRVARHANFETTLRHYTKGDVQKDAAKLRKPPYLGTAKRSNRRKSLHPVGLEPTTFGSVDRCSIQLS